MSKIHPVRVASKKWIAPGLPLGGVVLLAARDNVGKSPCAYHWLACVTAKKDFAADVPVLIEPSKALLFVGEGELETEVHPRLIAAGVNFGNIEVIDCVGGLRLDQIPDEVRKRPDVKFVVCDTLTSLATSLPATPSGLHKLLAPFHTLARERSVTFVFIHHHIKGGDARVPLDLIAGSKGLTNNIFYVWQLLEINPHGDAVLEMTKSRLMRKPLPAYEFKTEPVTVDGVDGTVPRAVVCDPVPADSPLRIEAILATKRRPDMKHQAGIFAENWFRAYLKDGPMPAAQGILDSIAAGITESTRNRVKAAIPVLSTNRGGQDSYWYIESPESPDEERKDPQDSQTLTTRSSDTTETCHYTPKEVMDSIHEVFGPCALDPASPPKPVHVQCLKCYAIERGEDGLKLSWKIPDDGHSYLFLNSPWSREVGKRYPIPLWTDKLLAERTLGHVPRAFILVPFRGSNSFDKIKDAGAAIINLRWLKFGGASGKTYYQTVCCLLGFSKAEVDELVASLLRHGVARASVMSYGLD